MHDSDLSRALATIAASGATTAQSPPAEEIRRRGTLRRKHRLVTVATGTAATLVAAFGLAFGASGQLTGEPQPAASESPPSVTDSALLRVTDLEALEEPDAGWEELPEPAKAADCAPTPQSVPETSNTLRRSFTIGNVYRLDQVIYDFPSAEAARKAFASESARVLECRPEGGKLADAWNLEGLGDEAMMAQFLAPDPDPDSDLVITVRLAQTGQAITSVTTSGLQQDWGLPDWTLGAAVSRLCGPAHGSCVQSNPKRVRTYPAPSDAPGFLQVSDLPQIAGAQWEAGPVHEPAEMADFETVCDVGLLSRSGANAQQERVYFAAIGDDPAAVTAVEAVAGFATEVDARGYLEQHRSSYSDCTELASGSLKPVVIDVGPHELSAWSAPDLGIYVAAVAIDDAVVVVHAGAGGERIIDEAAFHQLVAAAIARLG